CEGRGPEQCRVRGTEHRRRRADAERERRHGECRDAAHSPQRPEAVAQVVHRWERTGFVARMLTRDPRSAVRVPPPQGTGRFAPSSTEPDVARTTGLPDPRTADCGPD